MNNFLISLVCILISVQANAQYERPFSFLYDQVSVPLLGAGQTGTACLTSDALGFYYNPAQLGNSAHQNHFAFSFMLSPIKLSSLIPINVRSYGMQAGYNFQKANASLPLTIGVGFVHSNITFPPNYLGLDLYPDVGPQDSYNSFSIGASYKYFVDFNLGFTIKNIYSLLTSFRTPIGLKDYKFKGSAFDLGTLIVIPVSELWLDEQILTVKDFKIYPEANLSFGYAVNNIGKEFYFFDPSFGEPLPITARLGYSINLGFDIRFNDDKIKLIDYSLVCETDDILTNRDSLGVNNYEGMFGKTISAKHLFALKGDKDVALHKAHIFNLLETITYSTGRINGRYRFDIKTEGMSFSTKGLSKLINMLAENKTLNFVIQHFSVEYSRATMNYPLFLLEQSNTRKYESITFYISNFSF